MRVSNDNFDEAVIAASLDQPVLVAYLDPRYPPSQMQALLLERLAAARGDLSVVRIDTGESPELVRRYSLVGVPTVQVFDQGMLIDQFHGLISDTALEDFLDRLQPDVAEIFRKDAQTLVQAQQPEAALSRLEAGLAVAPRHMGILTDRIALLLDLGQTDAARNALGRLPDHCRNVPEVRELRLRAALLPASVESQIPQTPTDPLEAVRRMIQVGQWATAFDQLMVLLEEAHHSEEARDMALALIGKVTDPAQRAVLRRRLTSCLFR